MTRIEWKVALESQPPNLSVADLAQRIPQPVHQIRYWTGVLKYPRSDGRLHPNPEKFRGIRKVNLADMDFSETNLALAQKHGISRQRVWELRKLHHQPAAQLPVIEPGSPPVNDPPPPAPIYES